MDGLDSAFKSLTSSFPCLTKKGLVGCALCSGESFSMVSPLKDGSSFPILEGTH